MAFRPSVVIGLIWHHPIVSLVVALLFTPPLFPIVVYFSPLLISTALFLLAMISMESDHANDPSPYSDDIPYSRGVWIEEVELEGPLLDGERVPKRLKASSRDESWFDKVKNWEGTGRAWVESVLNQEGRKSFDENTFSRDESIPLLDKAKGLFIEDVRKRSRDDELKSGKPADGTEATLSSNDSAPSLPVEKLDSKDGLARPVSVVGGKSTSTAIPDPESEDELIEIKPASIPASPLFRKKSLPKADATLKVSTDLSKVSEVSQSKGPSKILDLRGGSVPGADSEGGHEIAHRLDSVHEKASCTPPVTEQKLVDCAAGDVENSSSGRSTATPNSAKESNSVAKDTAQSSGGEIIPENEAVSSGLGRTNASDRNVAEKSQVKVTTAGETGKSGPQPKETKSAAELLVPLRQGPSSYSLGTPSAAVALSEKLKVPLEDIMSLLAGDCKENASSAGPAGVEVSSSSETTTSQEEEWSSSDVESTAPLTTVKGPESVEKDP